MQNKTAEALKCDRIYILSAKYGLLKPDDIIEPYNYCFNNPSKQEEEIKSWSEKVIEDLKKDGCDIENDEFIIMASKLYKEYILSKFKKYNDIFSGNVWIGIQQNRMRQIYDK